MIQGELDLENSSWHGLKLKLDNAQHRLESLIAAHKAARELMNDEIANIVRELRTVCPHPEDKIERRHMDVPGSYNDRSEHTEWRVCTICGTESERVVTYGSFG